MFVCRRPISPFRQQKAGLCPALCQFEMFIGLKMGKYFIVIMTSYDNCFEKHSFHELNNIDIDKLTNVFNEFAQHHTIHENSVFIDVGCNAGSFIKVLERFRVTQNIHCFEPHPVLSTKVKDIYPYVHMNELCLSNYNGNISIYIPEWSVGLSSTVKRPVFDKLGQKIHVLETTAKTLDSYCQENNMKMIDFMKIDVEGGEKTVLEGARGMLSSHQIKAGVFEIGATLEDAGTSTNEVCALVQSYGYQINKTLSDSDYYFYLEG
jgi:FkbM family methyltransferase